MIFKFNLPLVFPSKNLSMIFSKNRVLSFCLDFGCHLKSKSAEMSGFIIYSIQKLDFLTDIRCDSKLKPFGSRKTSRFSNTVGIWITKTSEYRTFTCQVFRCQVFKCYFSIQTTIQIQVRYSNGGLNTRLNLVNYSNGIWITDHSAIGKLSTIWIQG